MTYIKRERRAAIDPIVDGLVKRLRSIDADRHDVAYAVTRVAMEAMRPQVRWTRASLIDCVASLYEAADEIEHRMVQPHTEAQIKLHGDLACFQDALAVLMPSPPGEGWVPVPEVFSVVSTKTGRWQGGQENACSEEVKSDPNPFVEVTNSLAPGMKLADLGITEEEGLSILDTLTDDQIEAAEKQRGQIEIKVKVNEDREGVTLTNIAAGHNISIPNCMCLGGNLDVVRQLLVASTNLNVWEMGISLAKWEQICSRTMPSNYEEANDGVSDTE
jgi:hypothetical protein